MKKPKSIPAIIVASILFVGVLLLVWVNGAANFLNHAVVPSAPGDVIVVLSGGTGKRMDTAIELLYKKMAPKIWVVGGGVLYRTSYTQLMSSYAQAQGISKAKITQIPDSQSTYGNAVSTRRYIESLPEANRPKSLIIVTSGFHTRRSWRVFNKVFKGSDVQLSLVAAPDKVDPRFWWKDYESTQTVLTEWAKTIVYWLKY